MTPIIPYSKLTVRELVDAYNSLAPARGVKPMVYFTQLKHQDMVMKVAMLRTRKLLEPVKPSKQPRNGLYAQGFRKIPPGTLLIIEELCKIDYHEIKRPSGKSGPRISATDAKKLGKGARSVGQPYSKILLTLKKKLPKLRLSGGTLRGYSTRARRSPGAYGDFTLPDYRPRENKGKTKGKTNGR